LNCVKIRYNGSSGISPVPPGTLEVSGFLFFYDRREETYSQAEKICGSVPADLERF
jgi:hypothetical protein